MRCSHTAWPFLTSSQLNVKIIEKPQMSEINPGIWDGLTPEQVTIFSATLESLAHVRSRSKNIILTIGRDSPMIRMLTERRERRVTTISVVRSCTRYLVIHMAQVPRSASRPGTY